MHNRVAAPVGMHTGQLKDVFRVLAASKPGAVAILIGEATVDYGSAVLEGLDMYSRLIVNVSSDVDLVAAADALHTDIRVALHAQPSAEFLADVKRHRFDLTVVDARLLDRVLGERVLAVTPVGGVVALVNIAGVMRPDWSGTCFESVIGGDCVLAVKLADNHRPARRGGRRARRT